MTPPSEADDRRAPVPVVHVITKLELGGAQQNTLHTVANLDRARFAPVLVTGPGGLLEEEARSLEDVPLHILDDLRRPISPGRDLAASRALRSLLETVAAGGPCVVHTHSSKAGIVGRWAACRAEVGPVVHSIHGFGHDAIRSGLKRWVALTLERTMARHTDAFISVSRANAEQGLDLGLIDDTPVHIIRSGIDVEDFARADALRAATRAELGYDDDTPVVGMIACLKPQKAPADFVAACVQVAESLPAARFFIAGDGELRGEVEALIAANELGDRVQLLGWRRDVPALLGALDVHVLSSRWEGLPRVAPQTMAAGRPMVATAVDGTPEAIVHERNGFLVQPGDVDGLAQHTLTLLRDTELRARFAAAGREAVSEFHQDVMVAQQEALYDALLAER